VRHADKKRAILHGILQFLFCLDVVSAVMVYIKTKLPFKNPSREYSLCLHAPQRAAAEKQTAAAHSPVFLIDFRFAAGCGRFVSSAQSIFCTAMRRMPASAALRGTCVTRAKCSACLVKQYPLPHPSFVSAR
jgi:hypothetical protein